MNRNFAISLLNIMMLGESIICGLKKSTWFVQETWISFNLFMKGMEYQITLKKNLLFKVLWIFWKSRK
jgi:hypothetical protein